METSFSESVVRFKAMVKKLGKEVFDYEASKLRDEMKSNNICPELINQVVLVLECSPAKKYLLSNSRVSTSDLNNMMSQISLCTGLKESVAFNLLNIMCEAAGVPFTVDPGPYLTKDKKVAFEVRKSAPKESSEQKLKIAEQYIEIKDCASEGYQMLTELAEEGEPRAFYLLGKYYYELSLEGDSADVPYMDYLVVAAEQGIPEASVLIGDIYYKTNRIIGHDNTRAFYFFSKPGVGHFDESHKEKIKELFSQKNILLQLVPVFIYAQAKQKNATNQPPNKEEEYKTASSPERSMHSI